MSSRTRRSPRGSRPARCRLVVLALLAAVGSGPEASARQSVGAAAGAALPLDPTGRPGVAAGLSTVLTGEALESAAMLHLRGEVLGIYSRDGAAVQPLLSGDLGLALGPVELYLSGGLELFGFAWRGGYTLFTTLGVLGGGGLAVRVHERVQVELRGLVTWVPGALAAKIKEPNPAPGVPTLLFVSALGGVVLSF